MWQRLSIPILCLFVIPLSGCSGKMRFIPTPKAPDQTIDLSERSVGTGTPTDQTKQIVSQVVRMDSPVSLTATAQRDPYRVLLTWQIASANSLALSVDVQSDFAVIHRSQGGAFIEIGQVAAGEQSFEDTEVSLGTYSYRVTFRRSDIESNPSNTISINLSAAIVRPTLTVASSQPGVITLGIINGNTVPSLVAVERSSDGVNFAQLSGLHSQTLTDTSVVGGAKYWYRARAISTVSSAGEVSESSYFCDPVTVLALALPSAITAPSNVTARQGTGLSVILSWSDNSSNETAFVIQIFNALGQPSASGGARVEANTTTTSVGVFSTGTYIYRIKAIHEAAATVVESSYAPDATVTVRSSPVLPATLSASNAGPSRVELSWSRISGIGELVSVQIHRSDKGDFYDMKGGVAPSVQNFSDSSGLGGGWSYFYKLVGVFRVPTYLDNTGRWTSEVLAESNVIVIKTE